VGALAGEGRDAAGAGPGPGPGTGTGAGLVTGAVVRFAGGGFTVGLSLDGLGGRSALFPLVLVRAANGAVTLAAMPAMLAMPVAGAPGASRSWVGGGT